MKLFTIGHSNHELVSFISLLKKHQITAVADVRSHPYSRFLTHFNQENLSDALKREKIYYVFLGRELGARPSNPECYVNGKALYEKISKTDLFQQGLTRVLNGLKKHRISLMCAEKDPITCHRAILICQQLRNFDIEINHILKNSDLEPHKFLEDRLLAKHGFTNFVENSSSEIQLSLFVQPNNNLLKREECLEMAYKLQGDEIAYQETRSENDGENHESFHDRIHSKKRAKIL